MIDARDNAALDCAGASGPGGLTSSAVLLLALVLALLSAAATAQDRSTVRLSSSPWVADAPTKVALALGAFDDVIEVVKANSGRASLDHLLAGDADFAMMATTPLALHACGFRDAGFVGQPVEPVILASVALSNNTHYVLADGETGIAARGDLAGRRIGVMFGTSAHFGWHQFARHAGLEGRGLEIVDLPIDQLVGALTSGRIDAGVLWSPWDRELVERWGDRARRFRIRAVDSVNWLLVSSRAFVRRRGEAVIDVLQAYAHAVDLLNSDPLRARDLHSRFSDEPLPDPEDPAVGVIWQLALDWSLLANLQANLDWCAERTGQSEHRVELGQFIEPGPMEVVEPSAVLLPTGMFPAEFSSRGRK